MGENFGVGNRLPPVISSTERVGVSLVAGALAGGLAKTVIAPFDLMKINFQVRQAPFSFYQGVQFLVHRYKRAGFTGLWKGNTATMARIVPYAAIKFASHEQYKHMLGVETHRQRKMYPGRAFLAGAMAGVTCSTMTYPLDLARARMAVAPNAEYTGLIQVFVRIRNEEGISSFYRGYVASLLGIIPYVGTSFFAYEKFKQLHHERTKAPQPSAIECMLFGSLAGMMGQCTAYPFEVIRRRIQTAKILGEEQYTLTSAFRKIVREEGLVKGLYKGLSINFIKGPIASGISFTTFDLLKDFLWQIRPLLRKTS